MPNWCVNKLFVEAPTKKRLQEFMKAAKDTDTELSLQNLFPMPADLDIESGSTTDNGLAILEYQNGNPNELHRMFEYGWVKEKDIKTFDALIKYLIDEKRADLELAKKALSNQEKYGHQDWYGWRSANWGIKWDVSATSEMIRKDGTKVVYYFESPWGPPIAAFTKICADYPDLEFTLEYEEPGMAFLGEAKFFEGVLASDDCREMTIEDAKERGYYTPEDDEENQNDENEDAFDPDEGDR